MQEAVRRAQTLSEALPYIRTFSGKTIVIKFGGSAMENEALKQMITQDIVLMRYVGIKPVVVHGGGKAISHLMEQLGIVPEFVGGNRVTDLRTMEVVEMVLAGKMNKEIVALINQAGGRAVGIEGKDGQLLEAKKTGKQELGLVGEIQVVNPRLLEVLEREGFIPVVAPVAGSTAGETLNINADIAAAEIAAALKAEKLIFLTDVNGILENPGNENSLIATITLSHIRELLATGAIEKGMVVKVQACQRALSGEVHKVHIINGKLPHSLLLEVFTDSGIGTQVIPDSSR
jgi:acetylglutamate kinase